MDDPELAALRAKRMAEMQAQVGAWLVFKPNGGSPLWESLDSLYCRLGGANQEDVPTNKLKQRRGRLLGIVLH
jgi:hypothetical protein